MISALNNLLPLHENFDLDDHGLIQNSIGYYRNQDEIIMGKSKE